MRSPIRVHSPVKLSQILAVLSMEAVRTEDPSAENTTEHTANTCRPDNVCLHSPVQLSQILTVISQEAVATKDPSAENVAEVKAIR